MLSHPLANLEIKKHYQNQPKFNCVYSRSSLTKIKDELYVPHFDGYESIETHWIVFYVNGDNIIYFDSFRVEHTPKEI